MKVVFVLLGAALFVAVGFLVAFILAVRHGQYDDVYTPSLRMLSDDRESPPEAGRNTDSARET